MSLPVCPNCGSGYIHTGYPLGSGDGKCMACGHIGVTRDFHAERPLIPVRSGIKASAPDPIVSPIPTRQRKPHHEPHTVPTVRADYWYLRD